MLRAIKRFALGAAVSVLLGLGGALGANAQGSGLVEVWKDPNCGCCSKWISRMKAAGFDVRVHDTRELGRIKSRNGIPRGLRSCHTAKAGGYVVEGHVPVADVQRLLQQKPKVLGISVPGMPIGSPGMEVASGEKEPYQVLTFDKQGRTTVFATHD